MMRKLGILIIMFLLACVLCTSGCIKTTPTNSTFGEKKISLDSLKVLNNTRSGNYTSESTNHYYVEGNISNSNPIDALNVKIKATFYDINGSAVVTNKTVYVYLEPKNIPANGISYFYIEVPDPKQEIVDFKINVIRAEAEL